MPYYSKSTVQAVKEIPIAEVVAPYVTLKNNTGHSPFTAENTPSFKVNPQKNYFKCFSSGEGGDTIQFIMKVENLPFTEAVSKLCQDHGINPEVEAMTKEEEKRWQEEQHKREAAQIALNFALQWFQDQPLPDGWEKQRGFTLKTLLKFSVGFAPDSFNGFLNAARQAGYKDEVLESAGLIRIKPEGKVFDFFKERVMFPIFDSRGVVVAFSGRTPYNLSEEVKKKRKEEGQFIPPKYMNSPDSCWEKDKHLYGIHLAADAIKREGFCYLVEGNPDVIRFHEVGKENVVAPCGTGLSFHQVKLLKRFTDTVYIVPDHDQKKVGDKVESPGIKALHRNAQMFLQEGFAVHVLMPAPGLDPDEHLRKLTGDKDRESWFNSHCEYLSVFYLKETREKALKSPIALSNEIKALGNLLELIPDQILKETYYKVLVKEWPDFSTYKLKKVSEVEDTRKTFNLMKEQKEEFYEFGFIESDHCYYGQKNVMISAFTMEYLYYVFTDDIPIYVIRFTNTFGKVLIRALNADQLTVVGEFKRIVGRFPGRFIFEGKEEHLNKINLKLRGEVNQAQELNRMGYHPEKGFWVIANGILKDGQLLKPDEYGVVCIDHPINTLEDFKAIPSETAIRVDGRSVKLENPLATIQEMGEEKVVALVQAGKIKLLEFYSLPFSDTRLRLYDDDYIDEKRFRFNVGSSFNFNQWAPLMKRVYKENAALMIGFYLMAVFRDTVYTRNKSYIPLLNLFGPPGQGKSTAARSLVRMFGETHGEDEGMNLNMDTASGIMEYVNKFENAIIWGNELSRNMRKEKEVKIEMMKAWAGGSTRKTRKTKAYSNANEKNRNASIISGQDSASFDPGLHDRVIPLKFEDTGERDRKAFEELTALERKGECTGVTVELIRLQPMFGTYYAELYPEVEKELTAVMEQEVQADTIPKMPEERHLINILSVIVPIKVLIERFKLEFPVTWAEVIGQARENLVYKMSIKSSTNEVATFFSVLTNARLVEGKHYKIVSEADGRAKLFLRLNQINGLYREAAIRQGESPFGISDIKDMLLMHRAAKDEEQVAPKYQLGLRKTGVSFNDSKSTSAIVLDYNKLKEEGIEIFTENEPEEPPQEKEPLNVPLKEKLYETLFANENHGKELDLSELHAKFNARYSPTVDPFTFIGESQQAALEYNKLMKREIASINGSTLRLQELI